MKTKIVEAMAAGVPVVTTPVGTQGLDVTSGEHLMIADEPAAFAERVLAVLSDPALAERMGQSGRRYVTTLCSPPVIDAGLEAMLDAVIDAGRPSIPPRDWLVKAARMYVPAAACDARPDSEIYCSYAHISGAPIMNAAETRSRVDDNGWARRQESGDDRVSHSFGDFMKLFPWFRVSPIPQIDPIAEDSGRPFWSVMLPTYNCTAIFEQTLRSVLEQDPGPDQMQIAVVDDCSESRLHEEIVRSIAPQPGRASSPAGEPGAGRQLEHLPRPESGPLGAYPAPGRPRAAWLLRTSRPGEPVSTSAPRSVATRSSMVRVARRVRCHWRGPRRVFWRTGLGRSSRSSISTVPRSRSGAKCTSASGVSGTTSDIASTGKCGCGSRTLTRSGTSLSCWHTTGSTTKARRAGWDDSA